MTDEEKEYVLDAIENEGFDYAIRHYIGFGNVKDKQFHKLREAYIKASQELEDYIGDLEFDEEV